MLMHADFFTVIFPFGKFEGERPWTVFLNRDTHMYAVYIYILYSYIYIHIFYNRMAIIYIYIHIIYIYIYIIYIYIYT